ncbi:MAG: 3-hydroxyacyl-CoA dehydrogenase NAD-binding domain-containing protein [Solirubrobacterales bacterium]
MTIERIGVVGAGTMGAGIAQLGCLGGFETLLHDPVGEILSSAPERIGTALEKGAAGGRWSGAEAEAASGRLRPCGSLSELAGCGLVIEAAPERLELKRELFASLAAECRPDAVLATNTSSLSVTAIAAAVPGPERVVGMHFFNPPALMALVEVVAGEESGEGALALAEEVARGMGRTPVRAADEIGFIVNRCARPYSLEALRLLGARIAGHETIDRICRIGGGFRMGPFELTDLVGVDVNLDVARSFWEQSFCEPRWQPHPIQARMVAAGRIGRKAGRGYYDYGNGPHRPEDPPAPGLGEGMGAGADQGEGAAGGRGRKGAERGPRGPETVEGEGFRALALERGSLGALATGEDAVGFLALPDPASATLVELTRGPATRAQTAAAAESHFRALGKQVEWVGDAPGLVLGRIVCQLVNEAHFALGAGVAGADDIDTAMRLGLNYPRGPFEWCEAIGPTRVLAIVDALHAELGEERYRAAPALRRAAATGRGR